MSLEELNLAGNQLTDFPAFTVTPNLRSVNLRGNLLRSLPYGAFSGVDARVFRSL